MKGGTDGMQIVSWNGNESTESLQKLEEKCTISGRNNFGVDSSANSQCKGGYKGAGWELLWANEWDTILVGRVKCRGNQNAPKQAKVFA